MDLHSSERVKKLLVLFVVSALVGLAVWWGHKKHAEEELKESFFSIPIPGDFLRLYNGPNWDSEWGLHTRAMAVKTGAIAACMVFLLGCVYIYVWQEWLRERYRERRRQTRLRLFGEEDD